MRNPAYHVGYLVAALCALIIILRAWLPDFRFDETSLILFAIGVVVLVLFELGDIYSRVRFKFRDIEVELERRLAALTVQTEEAERAMQETPPGEVEYRGLPVAVSNRLAEAASDPRAALLLVAIDIERAARELAESFGLPEATRPTSVLSVVRALTRQGVLPQEVQAAFMDFWAIRNQVVHGHHFELSEGRLFELVELGLRVLSLLSGGRKSGSKRGSGG